MGLHKQFLNSKLQGATNHQRIAYLHLGSGLSLGYGIVSETVLRLSLHDSLESHSTVTLTSPLSGLKSPVVASDSWVGESAFRAGLLLDMVGLLAASSASAVDFGVSLSETLGSFTFCHPTL